MKNYRYVIVFDYLRALTDSQNLLPQTLVENGFALDPGVFLQYPNLGAIKVYKRTDP